MTHAYIIDARKMSLFRKIAWLLPKWLVYWCVIRAWACATSGPYEGTDAASVATTEVLRRWEKT